LPDSDDRPRTRSVQHDERGKFRKGNTAGVDRSQPSYDRNLTRDIKTVLAEHGDDGLTWSKKIVRAMAKQAAGGNVKAAEWLGDRAEGKAVQRLDVDVMSKARILAEMYGLDPGEVASMARAIAEEEAGGTPLGVGDDSAFEGGHPAARNSISVDPQPASDTSE
jgi:hypothetical protein